MGDDVHGGLMSPGGLGRLDPFLLLGGIAGGDPLAPMSARVERLSVRRRLLQAECAVQRGEIGGIQSDLEAGAARADHVISVARRLTPLLLAAGVAAAVMIGPARLVGLARQGLALGVVASRASRLLR